jgi:nucleoside-diphosphate-sugar epimerase
MTADLHVVLGATGGVGAALVDALQVLGRPIRAVSRSPKVGSPGDSVDHVSADVATAEGAKAACTGAKIVYFATQPPYGEWPELFPAMTEHVLAGAQAAGAKLVMVDNLYMYGPQSGALHEQTPRAATGSKGSTRAGIERQLLSAHTTERVRVTIGRLSDYYGPNGLNSSLSALVLEPALKGKAMRWPGNPGMARTLHYLPDVAQGLIMLGDHDDADGGVWHLPSAAPITGNQFMALVNQVIDKPVGAKTMGATMMRIGGLFNEMAKESLEVMYQWTAPFIAESAKFAGTFGPLPTTAHGTAVAATVRWMHGTWLPNH